MKTLNRMIRNIAAHCISLFLLVYSVNVYADGPVVHQSIFYKEYIKAVEEGNLGYIAEKFNIPIAQAEVWAAGELPDPELEFEAADDAYSLQLGYTLELGGKRYARRRLARSLAGQEQLAVTLYFQELRVEATDAFLEAILQKEILRFKRSSYAYMLQLSQSDSIRHRLGEITENDARQSRLEAASLLNEVYQQEAEYQAALVVLNQYMGKTTEVLYEPQGDPGQTGLEYSLQDLLLIARDNRVELMMAMKNSEIAMNQLKLVKAERRLDLGIFVGYERAWGGLRPTRDALKGGVAIPLKFSNLNKGAVRASRFEAEKSKVEYQDTELQLQAEVTQAYFYYLAMEKQLAQFRAGLLGDTRKLLDGVVYTYKRGETDILEVLITQRTYNEMQEQYLGTLKGYASSLIELQRVCGIWTLDF
ncbi:MAG: TolC family protein [Bacteroides sp.]|nr:TolC family protein [Bacteroides sp.]